MSGCFLHVSAGGAFVICWTPGLVILLPDGLLGKDSHADAYEKFCLVIAVCNSLVNPSIDSLRDAEMWRTFMWILSCACQRRAPSLTGHDELDPGRGTCRRR